MLNFKYKYYMQGLMATFEDYREKVREIQEQFDAKYFQSGDLLKEIKQDEASIAEMLRQAETARKYIALQAEVQQSAYLPHPESKPIPLTAVKPAAIDSGQLQKIVQKVVIPNSHLQICLEIKRLVPYYYLNSDQRQARSQVPQCRFRLLLYHADQHDETGYLAYQQTRNLHKSYQGLDQSIRLSIKHEVTSSSCLVIGQVLRQSPIYILVEDEFRMITMCAQMSLAELIDHQESNLNKQLSRDIVFRFLGSSQPAFTLSCVASLTQIITSPSLEEVQEQLLPARVLSKSPTRSRSPSPTLHRDKARSVVKGHLHSPRVVVLNDQVLNVRVRLKNRKSMVVVSESQNIAKYYLDVVEQKEQLFLKILIKTKDAGLEGSLQAKLESTTYKIIVKPNKLFRFVTPEQAKVLFKTQDDCKNVHAIITLTDEVWLRPSLNVQILNNAVEYRTLRGSVNQFYIKTGGAQDESHPIFAHPVAITCVNRVENGSEVEFIVRGDRFQDKNQLKAVFALRKEQPKNIAVTKLPKNLNHPGIVLIQSTDPLIEFYVVRYTFIENPPTNIHLSLPAPEPGLYFLELGPLSRKCRFWLRSSNERLLQVRMPQFMESSAQNRVPVQVMEKIESQKKVSLYLTDLTKRSTTVIEVSLTQLAQPRNKR